MMGVGVGWIGGEALTTFPTLGWNFVVSLQLSVMGIVPLNRK